MNWKELDWKTLDRLRDGFLNGGAAEGPYWQSLEDLAHYNATYAERIGWKWDAVLSELRLRGWAPRGGTLLDWGCGSGVAGRRALAAFGAERFDSLLLWDHSPLAIDFSEQEARRRFPKLNVCGVTPGYLSGASPIGLLVISHVLNELTEAALAELRLLILRAEAVLWVEPGTHEVSRGLQTVRDQLLGEFQVIAPCTHQKSCPVLQPGRERDWCHFFAFPPSGIFADSDWVKFGQRAGIDLRSLPYAFLGLQAKTSPAPLPSGDGLTRVLGRPEHLKPYARMLACDASGVAEVTVAKRDLPAVLKELEKTKNPLVYRWKREGTKVVASEPLASNP